MKTIELIEAEPMYLLKEKGFPETTYKAMPIKYQTITAKVWDGQAKMKPVYSRTKLHRLTKIVGDELHISHHSDRMRYYLVAKITKRTLVNAKKTLQNAN